MDLNHLLLWIVALSCSVTLLRAVTFPPARTQGWTFLAAAILATTVGWLYFAPKWAGLWGGGLWAALVLLPTLLMRWVSMLTFKEQYLKASRLAYFIRCLHPGDGWLEYPHILGAIALAQRGESEAAIAILERYKSPFTPIGRIAAASLYRIQCRWDLFLEWVNRYSLNRLLHQDANLTLYYLRALGETGQLNELLQTLAALHPRLERSAASKTINQCRLYALAFCGRSHQVRELLHEMLSTFSPTLQQFWLATAELVEGNRVAATDRLQLLQFQSDAMMQRAIEYRLTQPPANPHQALSPASWHILQQVELETRQDARYGNPFTFISGRAYATYVLIALNLAMFAVAEAIGSSQSVDTLYKLGALVVEEVKQGQWWRLLAANFLHLGILHLGMNMLGLYFLGGFVETTLGRGRFLLVYFGSGIGTMILITILSLQFNAPPQILVGASAAIMGLIGALAGIMLYGWRKEKARTAAKNFRLLLFVMVIQTTFDLTTPGVSFMGHFLGFVTGFLICSLLMQQGGLKVKVVR